jgi:hypothetical protein
LHKSVLDKSAFPLYIEETAQMGHARASHPFAELADLQKGYVFLPKIYGYRGK